MISRERSYSLTNTKFILTFLIVYLHCHIQPLSIENVSGGYVIWERFMQIICDCAVPGFFAMSAYLLFHNFDLERYWDKVQSRFKSLLVPYFIFSVFGLILEIVIEVLLYRHVEISVIDSIRSFFTREYNRPLWYLLILFEYVLVAPAIYLFIQKYRKKGVFFGGVVLLFINLILEKTTYVNLFYWSPLLLLFSYIGFRDKESDYLSINIPWYYGFVFILIAVAYTFFGGDINHNNVYYLYRLIAGASIFFLGRVLTRKPWSISKYSMFVFCTHWLVNQLVFFIPRAEYFSLIKVMVVFFICTVTGMVLNKVTPQIYSLFVGSR